MTIIKNPPQQLFPNFRRREKRTMQNCRNLKITGSSGQAGAKIRRFWTKPSGEVVPRSITNSLARWFLLNRFQFLYRCSQSAQGGSRIRVRRVWLSPFREAAQPNHEGSIVSIFSNYKVPQGIQRASASISSINPTTDIFGFSQFDL